MNNDSFIKVVFTSGTTGISLLVFNFGAAPFGISEKGTAGTVLLFLSLCQARRPAGWGEGDSCPS